MKQPNSTEYASFYAHYVGLAPEQNGLVALRDSKREALELWKQWPITKQEFAYDTGKWTPKDLIQHLIDSERVFAYRALSIGRGDRTSLPGFDQDEYVLSAKAKNRTWHDLLEEFESVRSSSIALFESLSEESENKGNANGDDISVRALCFICSGHLRHHLQIMKERYL